MSQNKIVIDHGSFSIKYGYAGYDKPAGSIRSLVVTDYDDYSNINNNINNINKKEDYITDINNNENYITDINNKKDYITDIGETFTKPFHGMDIIYPIKNGTIVDFDAMEILWEDIFFEKLDVNPKITSVLFTESILTPEKNRETIKEIMFEKFNFDKLQFCNQQIVSLYGSGKSTGIILDIGHDLTRCIPIYDSFLIGQGVQVSNLAGKHFNRHINKDLNLNYLPDDWMDNYKKNYFKTKGKTLYRDFFIDSNVSNQDCPSIPELISRSIKLSDIDLRKDLAKNIVMVGGTSKIPGLCKDIYDALEKHDYLKYKISASKQRQYSAWLGGSILSSLPTFDGSWLNHKMI